MAYAVVADVKARLGRYAPLLAVAGSAQHPNDDDATAFLADVTAEIDNAIESRGLDPALLDASAQVALKDLAAFGAIARLLAGVPMDADLEKAAVYARKFWTAAMGDPTATSDKAVMGTFRTGSHPVIASLEAGRAGGQPSSAGGFWTEEPEYGSLAWQRAQQALARAGALSPSIEPGFYKGMSG